jgi:mRNA-degrading endonuclease HigB of HigAB toxin-antitoxin module
MILTFAVALASALAVKNRLLFAVVTAHYVVNIALNLLKIAVAAAFHAKNVYIRKICASV